MSTQERQQHAVHRLYDYRKSLSTKPFAARGKKLVRCDLCLLGIQFCTCHLRRSLTTDISVMLIMYDNEVLKPTNSGRLIADLIPDTYAYLWSRTNPDAEMLAVLNNSNYQPILVFPQEYIDNKSLVHTKIDPQQLDGKLPLLIFLDGSWREAIKMYRKSDYLQGLPVLSISPDALATYALRKGSHDFQLGTAEVAALAISACQEPLNGQVLARWFDLFVESSLLGRNRRAKETLAPIDKYINAYLAAFDLANK